jgi:hypothetical protein
MSHAGAYTTALQGRPILEVEIAAVNRQGVLQGRAIRTTVLVDSGADVTMLDGRLAPTLGIDLSRCPHTHVGGVGAGGVPVAVATLKMGLCDHWYEVPVNFTLNAIGHTQLLGRAGAFDQVIFTFVHRHRVVMASAA